MDPLRWKRTCELFAAAHELDGEKRVQFLAEQCRDDPSVREEVLHLLEQDVKKGPLDSQPTVSNLRISGIIAGRFRILRYVAEGGMGTVYEAEDLQLHERVALKTIRADVATDANAIQRFKREIQLGKSITHPNVCRIHDLVVDRSEDGTEVYSLSMQFLDGGTLASRIKQGAIPQSEALPLIEDMADGLSAAHRAGVVHRDFKSGNVMLVERDGRTQAVITDFGLARDIRGDPSRTLTQFAGTPDYMAPEQIRGEEVSPATDIYAFGVVMYEMVTGQRPFTGDSVASQHLREKPRPPKELVPHLDARWNGAILNCLRKQPSERLQTADEVKAGLAQNGTSRKLLSRRLKRRTISWRLVALSVVTSLVVLTLSAIPAVRRTVQEWLYLGAVPHVGQLAVLPLGVPTDDPQSAAIEYGLADTLATRLTKLTGTSPLQIVPASEIRAKDVTTLDQARQEFGVNLGLELSLRRSGDTVRVNYHLVDAKTHREIRGDTITAPISDGFAIEDRVADSVVNAMELDLQPQERGVLAEHGTQQSAAYDFYLQGRGYLEEYEKPENVESAITVFTHALEKDPHYALAVAGLGEAYWRKYELSNDKSVAMMAKDACGKAVTMGPTQADTHICLGLIDNGTGQYGDAVEQYQLALQLEPANDNAIRGLAKAYKDLGRPDEAEKTYKSAIATRPSYSLGYNELGKLYFADGNYQQAADMFMQVTKLAPDSFQGYSNLGGAYLMLGRNTEAVANLNHSIAIRPTYPAYSNLATALFRLGEYSKAADTFNSALSLNDKSYTVWGNLANAYHYAGNEQYAKSSFKKAIALASARLDVNPRDSGVLVDIATYYSALGKRPEAESYISKALEGPGSRDPDLLFRAAIVYNDLGESDEAITFLSKAISAGYSVKLIRSVPALEGLHSNKKFQSLVNARELAQ